MSDKIHQALPAILCVGQRSRDTCAHAGESLGPTVDSRPLTSTYTSDLAEDPLHHKILSSTALDGPKLLDVRERLRSNYMTVYDCQLSILFLLQSVTM